MSGTAMIFEIAFRFKNGKTGPGGIYMPQLLGATWTGVTNAYESMSMTVRSSQNIQTPRTKGTKILPNVFQPVDSNSNSQTKNMKKSVRKKNIYPNLVNLLPPQKKGEKQKKQKYATKNCLILGFSYSCNCLNLPKRCWNFHCRHCEIQTFRCVSSFSNFCSFDVWQLLGTFKVGRLTDHRWVTSIPTLYMRL